MEYLLIVSSSLLLAIILLYAGFVKRFLRQNSKRRGILPQYRPIWYLHVAETFERFLVSYIGVRLTSIDERKIIKCLNETKPHPAIFADQNEVNCLWIAFIKAVSHPAYQNLLTILGRLTLSSDNYRLCKGRMAVMEYVARFPQISKIETKRPVFILGLPRTGSTLLYNLLACDPLTRSPFEWEMFPSKANPTPPRTGPEYRAHPNYVEASQEFREGCRMCPEWRTAMNNSHPIHPDYAADDASIMRYQLP